MFLLCLPYFAVLFARKAVEMVTQRAGRVDVYFREGCCEAGGEAMLRLGVGISGTRSVPVPGSRQWGQDGAGEVVGTQQHLREQLLVASWDSSLRPQRPDPSLGDFAVPPSHPQPALTGVRMVYPSFPKA